MPNPHQPSSASEQFIGQQVPSKFVVETFSGSNESLQSFVEATWSEAYSGRMSFPVWSKEYFDWQLTPRDGQPDRRLAVYDQGQLVAVLLGTSARFQTKTGSLSGAHWSWLSVAASHRGCGLATLLDEARVELEKSVSNDLIVSYRFVGSKHSLAEQPSNRFPLKKFHSRVGLWARPLDGRRLQKWNLDRTEGFLSRLVSPFLPSVNWQQTEQVRLFGPEDLDDCLKVANDQFQNYGLSIAWDEESLRHQLAGNPITQTIVALRDGRVRGFANFHILPFQGITRESVGIIDLICADSLPRKTQGMLIRHTLGLMREQGAILALKIRCGDVPTGLMLRTGFTPRLPDSSLVLQWTQSVRDIPRSQPLHLLWR